MVHPPSPKNCRGPWGGPPLKISWGRPRQSPLWIGRLDPDWTHPLWVSCQLVVGGVVQPGHPDRMALVNLGLLGPSQTIEVNSGCTHHRTRHPISEPKCVECVRPIQDLRMYLLNHSKDAPTSCPTSYLDRRAHVWIRGGFDSET